MIFAARVRFGLAAGCVLATLGPLVAGAAERVTLKSGFDIDCTRREVVDGRVRLYVDSSGGYTEVAPDAIVKVETVPDAPAVVDAPKQVSTAVSAGLVNSDIERLTRAEMEEMLGHAGAQHNIDEDLLASVVRAESDGQVRAVSRAGAQGLMQLMPGTADELGVKDAFQPEQNINGGTAYLDALLTRYHDNLALALAAYNAGPAAVDRYHGVPPYRETRAYVARVIREFNRRKLARQVAAK
jgi:hypothetical protein